MLFEKYDKKYNFTFTRSLTRDWYVLRMVFGLKGQARLCYQVCACYQMCLWGNSCHSDGRGVGTLGGAEAKRQYWAVSLTHNQG